MDSINVLTEQKERSRAAAVVDTDDWVIVRKEDQVEFVGYDELECEYRNSSLPESKSKR